MTTALPHALAFRNRHDESRRNFTRQTIAFLAAGALSAVAPQIRAASPPAVAPATGSTQLIPSEFLTRSLFSPHLGRLFQITQAANVTAIELVKVRDLSSVPAFVAQGRTVDPEQNFSIVFRGELDKPLGQDVYELTHDLVGCFSLLLVPMRPEHDGRYYEAIFNRLREKE